jgi:hypothetical protein
MGLRKTKKYIIPVLVTTTRLVAQEQDPGIGFGFSHGVFTSVSYARTVTLPAQTFAPNERTQTRTPQPESFSQSTYGFMYGAFLWVRATDDIHIRPEVMMGLANYTVRNGAATAQPLRATSADIAIANQVVVSLRPNNTHAVLKGARCMSYYLTGKQPYVIVGPKVGFRKYDRGFLQRGFDNEASIGLVAGYGVNYGFHNMNFAPEIKYSVEMSAQNRPNTHHKIVHTISVCISMF